MKIESTNMEIDIEQQKMLIQWKMKPTKTVMECKFQPPKLDTMDLTNKLWGKSGKPNKRPTHFSNLADLPFPVKLDGWGSTSSKVAHNQYNSAFSVNIYAHWA